MSSDILDTTPSGRSNGRSVRAGAGPAATSPGDISIPPTSPPARPPNPTLTTPTLTDQQLQAVAILKLEPGVSSAEIARRLGVSDQTICKWRKIPEFQEWTAKIQSLTSTKYLRDLSFLKAAQGDVQWFKVHMQFFSDDDGGIDEFAESMEMDEAVLERIAHDAYEYVKSRAA